MRTSEGTVALLGAYTRELELVFTNEDNKKRLGAAAWGGSHFIECPNPYRRS